MKMTFAEIKKNYKDLDETFLINNFEEDQTDDEKEYSVKKVAEDEEIFDSKGNKWTNITNETYEVSDIENTFTFGYVYEKENF